MKCPLCGCYLEGVPERCSGCGARIRYTERSRSTSKSSGRSVSASVFVIAIAAFAILFTVHAACYLYLDGYELDPYMSESEINSYESASDLYQWTELLIYLTLAIIPLPVGYKVLVLRTQ